MSAPAEFKNMVQAPASPFVRLTTIVLTLIQNCPRPETLRMKLVETTHVDAVLGAEAANGETQWTLGIKHIRPQNMIDAFGEEYTEREVRKAVREFITGFEGRLRSQTGICAKVAIPMNALDQWLITWSTPR